MSKPLSVLATPAAPDSRYLDTAQDVIRCLKQVRDQRLDLDLRVDGSAQRYRCKILDVSERDFLIEDIFPRDGITALRAAKKFSLSARGAGSYMYIESAKLLKGDEERGIPYFHIGLPKKVLSQQRRRDARFMIPLRVSAAGASITMFEKDSTSGSIIDISAGGCRAEFSLPAPWPVKSDEHFKSCAITIPNLLEIHSEGVVRHFHENKHNKTLVCGIELTKMNVTDRRRLEHFIQTIAKNSESS